MADLDIFFAKKDKKKPKGRKYDNPDEIAKRLKESEKKLEKEFFKVEPVKKTLDEVLSNTSNSGKESVSPDPKPEKIKEEEEWKDFQDDSQKDLTNLKISKLQIEDDEDGVTGYGSGEDDDGTGKGNKSEGVWNKRERQELESVPEVETSVPAMKEEAKSQDGGGGGGGMGIKGSYVPPHLRNASSGSPLSRGGGGYRKLKAAPDITNAMAFPCLGDTKTTAPVSAWGRKKTGTIANDDRGFENVKHGSSRTYTDDYAPPKLLTTNRFDALSDNS